MEPMFYVRLAVVAIITIFFILQFIKHKKIFQLLIAIWAPITMLGYLPMDTTCTIILAAIQFIFFLTVIFLLFKSSRANVKNIANEMLEKNKDSELDTITVEESKE